jgi:hypothetical protein
LRKPLTFNTQNNENTIIFIVCVVDAELALSEKQKKGQIFTGNMPYLTQLAVNPNGILAVQ